jgi:hypothetical protein
VEGGDLVFRILRRGNDGNRHRIALAYSPAELLDDPPPNLIVGPSEPVTQLRLRTIAGPDEEGTRLVNVRLTDASGGALIGSRNLARGVIEDVPVAPTNYSVRPDGIANRGEAIQFIVSRTGPLAESDIEYGMGQGGMPIGTERARRIHFAAGREAWPITVLPADYKPCGEPVNVTLLGVASDAPTAVAAFSDFVPDACKEATPPTPQPVPTDAVTPEPSPTLGPNGNPQPNWFLIDLAIKWWPALAVILLSVLGFIFRAIKRAAERKKQLVEKLTGIDLDPEPEPAPKPDPSTAPAQAVSATCRIESGISELIGDEDKMQAWPGFRARVTLERGMASVPDPLPIAEEPNG